MASREEVRLIALQLRNCSLDLSLDTGESGGQMDSLFSGDTLCCCRGCALPFPGLSVVMVVVLVLVLVVVVVVEVDVEVVVGLEGGLVEPPGTACCTIRGGLA